MIRRWRCLSLTWDGAYTTDGGVFHSITGTMRRASESLLIFCRKNWFILGLVGVLLLGWAFSSAGAQMNPGGWTNRIVVSILFLLTGLTLPSERILRDLANPRLHITAQLFIFVVVPLYFLTAAPIFGHLLDGKLVIGIYALAVLPTSVSSCVVFTQNSGGNTVGAVFNASLANMVGVFLSPVLLSLILSTSGRALPIEQLLGTLRSLGLNMLAPIVLGNVVRIWVKPWVERERKRISVISSSLILFMVFLAFARTANDPSFGRYMAAFSGPIVYLAVSHLLLVGLAIGLGLLLKMRREDRVALIYVAPQKTLALGVPLLSIYFADQELLGIVLLPIVFYHPFQILVAGLLRSLPFVRAAAAASSGEEPGQ